MAKRTWIQWLPTGQQINYEENEVMAKLNLTPGETYPLTGFPAKKLQNWLRQVGVQEI